MKTSPASNEGARRLVRLAILLVLRLSGLVLFGLGLLYWVRLVGIYPEPGWRFDLMSVPWRVAASTLAVLCPVAGVGLWLAVSWGGVVWVLIAVLQAGMHFVLARDFGPPGLELAFHAGGLTLFAALRALRWWISRPRKA
jgi:hypothetical protein